MRESEWKSCIDGVFEFVVNHLKFKSNLQKKRKSYSW